MKKYNILSVILLCCSQIVYSQIKEEQLILDRKREPEVKKIEKKKTSVETIKNYPPEEKSAQPVNYNITNVPAVSDFTTSPIKGEDMAPKLGADFQKNYFRIGYGNYAQFLADGSIATTLENKTELGANVHYLSNKGLRNEYPWSSEMSNGSVGAFLNGFQENGKYNLDAEFGLRDYNYYGIYAYNTASDVDLKQNVKSIQVNGYYDFYRNEILNDFRVKTSFLNDHFDAKESQVSALLNLSKHGLSLPWEQINLNADVGIGLDHINSNFAILQQNRNSIFNVGVTPKVTFYKDQSSLTIGSQINFLNTKNQNLVLVNEQSTNKILWFPKVDLTVGVTKEFNFFAGIGGGLEHNSYATMLERNPFLLSDQMIMPTEKRFEVFFGLKGDLDQTLKYHVQAGFAKLRNIMYFRANGIFDQIASLNRSAYNFANTFSAAYDNGSVTTVQGTLQYFPLENLTVDAGLQIAKYKMDNFESIYNIPVARLDLGAQYVMLEKKLLLGFKGFLVTDRMTNSYRDISYLINQTQPFQFFMEENTKDKIGGYADLNLSAEYKVHKNFSIFALGNNLLNTKYETFKGYKVLGAQIIGGIKLSF